jgi:hypothetical protein
MSGLSWSSVAIGVTIVLLLVPDSELSCDNRAPREFTATIANLGLFDGSLSKLDKVVTHFQPRPALGRTLRPENTLNESRTTPFQLYSTRICHK